MKALKEKRISLRSLWRRGLVILSLFALVFASCGDSSSGGGDSGGKRVDGVKVKTNPVNDQYLGQPVDLTGAVLTVYYSDGTKEDIPYASGNFTATPRVYTGSYKYNAGDGMYDFIGMSYCQINYQGFRGTAYFDDVRKWGIVRTDAKTTGTVDGSIWGVDQANYSMGLNLTGTAAKEAYADQDSFDFSGLTLEAEYFYKINKDNLLRDKKAVSFGDITYKIRPSYIDADGNKTKEGDDTTGYVSITVGQNTDYWGVPYDWDNWQYDSSYIVGGVTTSHKLDTVHIVTKIALAGAPAFGDYYYWQPNDYDAWLERLGDDAELVVSYSGGKPDRKLNIKDLDGKRLIWANGEAERGDGDPNTKQPYAYNDFDIVPIQYPLTVKANPEPGIVLYYRGATTKVPVDVLTTPVGITAVSKAGGDIIFDPASVSDNDIRVQEAALADLIDVTATYKAYNNDSVQATLKLVHKAAVEDKIAKATKQLEYIPYYTFAKDDSDSTLDSALEKWEAAVLAGKKDSIVKAVTVGHSVTEADFDDSGAFGYEFLAPDFGWNLVREAVQVGSDYYRGWVWKQNNASPISGIKQPPKAATAKPSVTFVVKD